MISGSPGDKASTRSRGPVSRVTCHGNKTPLSPSTYTSSRLSVLMRMGGKHTLQRPKTMAWLRRRCDLLRRTSYPMRMASPDTSSAVVLRASITTVCIAPAVLIQPSCYAVRVSLSTFPIISLFLSPYPPSLQSPPSCPPIHLPHDLPLPDPPSLQQAPSFFLPLPPFPRSPSSFHVAMDACCMLM